MAACFKVVYPDARTNDFHANVSMRVCGDDNVLAIKAFVFESYNFITIQRILAQHGITITSGRKDGVSVPDIPRQLLTFCKKQILYSTELAAYVPFVSFHTLMDQLSYSRDTTREGLIQIIASALQWSFFRGETKYNGEIPNDEPLFSEQRQIMCAIAGIEPHNFPDYNDFRARYFAAGRQHALVTYSTTHMPSTTNYEKFSFQADGLCIPDGQAEGGTMSIHTDNFYGNGDSDISPERQTAEPNIGVPPVPAAGMDMPINGSTVSTAVDDALELGVIAESARLTPQHATMAPVVTCNGPLLRPNLNGVQSGVVMDDDMSTGFHATNKNFGAEVNETSSTFFKHQFGLVGVYNCDGEPASIIFDLPVHPFQKQPKNLFEKYTPTPTEFLALVHTFWRGPLRFRIQFIAPRDVTMRMSLHYIVGQPNPQPAITIDQANQYPTLNYTFDASNRELLYEAADFNAIPWKINPAREGTFPTLTDSSCNGRLIAIMHQKPLSNINYNRLGQIIVTFAGGKNFDVRCTRVPPWISLDPVSKPPALRHHEGYEVVDAVPESGEAPQEVGEMGDPVPTESLPPLIAPNSGIGQADKVAYIQESNESTAAIPAATTRVQFVNEMRQNTVPSIRFDRLANRYVVLTQLQIAGDTVSQYAVATPKELLKGQALYLAKSALYWRGKAMFRFTPITNGTAGGLVIAAWWPYRTGTPSIEQLYSLPHVEIDLSSNQKVDFSVPFQYFQDFFKGPDVISGGLHLFILGTVQYPTVGNIAYVPLRIEVAWADFEVCVPVPVPTCPAEYDPHGQGTIVGESGGKGKSSGMSIDTANMTSAARNYSHITVNKTPPLAPLTATKASVVERDLIHICHRPTLVFADTLTIPPGGKEVIELENPTSWQDNTLTRARGFQPILAALYAAFYGDWVWDIITNSTEQNSRIYARTTTQTGDDEIDLVNMIGLPVPAPVIGNQDCRFGYGAVDEPYPSNATDPTTTAHLPGKITLRNCIRSNNRYVASTTGLFDSGDNTVSFVALWRGSEASETDHVDIEAYLSLGDGARYGIFTGMVPFYVSATNNQAGATSVITNYPDWHFLPPL